MSVKRDRSLLGSNNTPGTTGSDFLEMGIEAPAAGMNLLWSISKDSPTSLREPAGRKQALCCLWPAVMCSFGIQSVLEGSAPPDSQQVGSQRPAASQNQTSG